MYNAIITIVFLGTLGISYYAHTHTRACHQYTCEYCNNHTYKAFAHDGQN